VPSEHLSGAAENDPAQILEAADWDRHYQGQLQRSLSTLDERTRDILVRRYLIEPKATLHELAQEYGVSAERIRQIENRAFKDLREALAA
jgi:RNA polymerase sigma-32 factor